MTVTINNGPSMTYFLTDHLGSIEAVLDDEGNILSEQRYLPFGGVRNVSDKSPVTETDYGYTFQRNLPSIGLYDYKARLYDPTTGSFIQPDSLVGGNRYVYVSNNPINMNDPLGKVQCKKVLSPGVHSEEDCGDDALYYGGSAPKKEGSMSAILSSLPSAGNYNEGLTPELPIPLIGSGTLTFGTSRYSSQRTNTNNNVIVWQNNSGNSIEVDYGRDSNLSVELQNDKITIGSRIQIKSSQNGEITVNDYSSSYFSIDLSNNDLSITSTSNYVDKEIVNDSFVLNLTLGDYVEFKNIKSVAEFGVVAVTGIVVGLLFGPSVYDAVTSGLQKAFGAIP